MKLSSKSNNSTKDEFLATKVEEPTSDDFTPPVTPKTIPIGYARGRRRFLGRGLDRRVEHVTGRAGGCFDRGLRRPPVAGAERAHERRREPFDRSAAAR